MSTCVLEHHGQPEESQVYVLLGDALSLCVIVFACFWLFYWVYKNYKSKSIYSVIYWYFQTVKKT